MELLCMALLVLPPVICALAALASANDAMAAIVIFIIRLSPMRPRFHRRSLGLNGPKHFVERLRQQIRELGDELLAAFA